MAVMSKGGILGWRLAPDLAGNALTNVAGSALAILPAPASTGELGAEASHATSLADNWAAGASGNWSTAANWSNGVPNALSFVTVAVPGAYTVTISSDVQAQTLTIANASATVADAGSLLEIGTTLSVASGTLAVSGGGSVSGALLSIASQGTLLATSGATIGAAVSDLGEINIVSGTLELDGGGSLGGIITGAGTLALGGGTFIDTAADLGGVADLEVFGNATLSIGSGTDVSLSGALSFGLPGNAYNGSGSLTGSGTLTTAGTTTISNSNAGMSGPGIELGSITWINTGTVEDRGYALLGIASQQNTVTIFNEAGASFYLTSDFSTLAINGFAGASTYNFTNAGTLAKTSGSGTSVLDMYVNNTGLIYVVSGTLMLGNGGTLGGTLGGAGTLDLGGGIFTSTIDVLNGAAALAIDNSTLMISGPSGTLTTPIAFGNADLAVAAGTDLTLLGSLVTFAESQGFSGLGTLTTTGSTAFSDYGTFTLSGGIDWINAGTFDLDGSIKLNLISHDSVRIVNEAGANFILSGGNILQNSNTYGSKDIFDNAGTITQASGSSSEIAMSVVNTGVIDVASGGLKFLGKVAGNGLFEIGGAANLSLVGASSGQTVEFMAGTGQLELTHALKFAGTIANFGANDVIDLIKTIHTKDIGYSYNAGILTVTSGSTTIASLHFAGSYDTADFAIQSIGQGNFAITFV